MKTWFHHLLLAALCVILAALTFTAWPAVEGYPVHGQTLLMHMMASGALVVCLPCYAVLFLWRNLDRASTAATQRLGFWAVLASGFVTIATVFACMMPLASTETMHLLIQWHGYAGFAMVPAALLLVWGVSRTRTLQARRM